MRNILGTSRLRRPSGPLKYRTYAPDRICGQTNRQTDSVSQSRFNVVGYFLFSPGPARRGRVPYVYTDLPAANFQRQVQPRYAYRTFPHSLQPATGLLVRVLNHTNPKIELKLLVLYPRSMSTVLRTNPVSFQGSYWPRLARIRKRVVASQTMATSEYE